MTLNVHRLGEINAQGQGMFQMRRILKDVGRLNTIPVDKHFTPRLADEFPRCIGSAACTSSRSCIIFYEGFKWMFVSDSWSLRTIRIEQISKASLVDDEHTPIVRTHVPVVFDSSLTDLAVAVLDKFMSREK